MNQTDSRLEAILKPILPTDAEIVEKYNEMDGQHQDTETALYETVRYFCRRTVSRAMNKKEG